MINKKLSHYVDFIERDGVETVWRIHIDETFTSGSKDPDCEDPHGIEEISEKLEEKIKDKIGRVMVLYGIKEIFEKLNALIEVLEKSSKN